ncbi:MAG TPA: tetratricopeptide repeat protein [Candidatus Acidoferrales bacterium]|nr:tetratricopeptide repeat protein [Candidatus Acidoferrales bacterium]
MSRLCIATAVLISTLIIPSRVFAQGLGANNTDAVSLTGTIYSEKSKRPVEQANVRLNDTGGNLIEQTITTESGEFDFRGIRRSNYILTVEAAGYQSDSLHIELSFASDRGISVYLKPKETDPAAVFSAANISAHEMSMPQKARDLLASGEKKLYSDKNPKMALLDFQQAVSVAPSFYEVYYQIGMAYLTLGTRDEAEKSFRKSVEVSNDKYGEPLIGLASLLIDTGDIAQSEQMLRHGLELSPSDWFGHYQLGRILFNQDKFAEALKSAEQARSLAPNAPIVYRLLSNIHLSQKDYPALIQDLDVYIKLDPDSPAGVRAKEIRKQAEEQISKDKPNPAASPSP